MTPPRKFSALPPAGINGASPKAISGRTSYLRVRLEFLRYPHLIATLFNGCASGPPLPLTAASAWPWVGHPVSGLRGPTHALLRLGLPTAPRLAALNLAGSRSSPDRSTESTRSATYGRPTVCRHRVSGSLSLPSRGPFHLSFTVLCAIGHWVVFSLAGWSPHVPPRFHVSRRTLDPALPCQASGTGLSPSPAGFPKAIPLPSPVINAVRTPAYVYAGLGCSHFARRYSGNRSFFLFLRLLRCFSSPGPPPCVMCWRMDTQGPPAWVSPFRHLRITGYLPLPAAFRSLSRLSSAPSAKASALCPYLLDLVLSSCSPARPRGIALPPAGRMVAHAYKSLRYIVQNN